MRSKIVPVTLMLALVPTLLFGQDAGAVPRRLTLAEAINLARQNAPAYRQALNDEEVAGAQTRAAYGSLLPQLSTSASLGYARAGRQQLANQIFSQGSSTVSSSYNVSISMGLSYARLLAPSESRAIERATEEGIAAAGVNLVADITLQYLAALRADASVQVAEQQVARNADFLSLAQAQFQVGRGNMVEVRQAEVAKANADVQLLRAQQQTKAARIELLRRIGLPAGPDVGSLELPQQFALVEPQFDLAALQRQAREQNPALRAADARADAANIGVRSAKSEYLPSFGISTGFSGFTQQATNVDRLLAGQVAGAQAAVANCAFQNAILERLTSPHPAPGGGIIPDCNAYAGLDASGTRLLPDVEAQIRDANDNFPFGFTRSPWSISLGISLPIFDGFAREARISSARAQADDAHEALRAERLLIDGQVQAELLAVETNWRAAQIADSNRAAAAEQLALARDRYRLGAGTALDVADAQNAVAQAEAGYVNAVYDYHAAIAGLEAAVGRPLR